MAQSKLLTTRRKLPIGTRRISTASSRDSDAQRPTSAVVLECEARRFPECDRPTVLPMDHRVDARGADGLRPESSFSEQHRGDAVSSLFGMHDEAVHVATPAVPTNDDRPHDRSVARHSHDQRVRVSPQQPACFVVLARATSRATESAPQINNRIEIVIGCTSDREHPNILAARPGSGASHGKVRSPGRVPRARSRRSGGRALRCVRASASGRRRASARAGHPG